MTVITLTRTTYDEFITHTGLVLTNFWSTSCGPCLRFRRIYQAAAQEIPEAAFGEAEVELQQLLVRDLAIAVIPTLFIYRDGELIYRDPTPGPGTGTFSLVADAPPLLNLMYRQEEFVGFVRTLVSAP